MLHLNDFVIYVTVARSLYHDLFWYWIHFSFVNEEYQPH